MKRERQIYKPSDLTQALAVFRDVHELLERHGRAGYPQDLHERAKRVLLLLADKTDVTEFREPPDHGSNVKEETPKTQESGRRQNCTSLVNSSSLRFARRAVRSLCPNG